MRVARPASEPKRAPHRARGAGRSGALLALAVALALACATTLATREEPALEQARAPIERIAVAPLRAGVPLAQDPAAARLATTLVGRYLAEALGERGRTVIPPDDVVRGLGLEPEAEVDAASLAEQAARRFGAQGLLAGRVVRFRGREGQALGATQPASVGFEVVLYAAPGGDVLWRASFEETQRPLFENVTNFFRYPGRGMRWLTAEELARWGAREVAGALPLEP